MKTAPAGGPDQKLLPAHPRSLPPANDPSQALAQAHGYYRSYDIPSAAELADALLRRQAIEEVRAEQRQEARIVGAHLAATLP